MSEHQTDHRPETKGGCGKSIPAGVASVVDPVCGMKVDPATSKHTLDYDGTTYHFC